MRILALLTDAFGGHGGIALYNRDLLTALCDHPECDEVVAIPRVMPRQSEPQPEKLTYVTVGLSGKIAYLKAVWRTVRKNPRFDLIVCGHINLLPIAFALRILLRVPLVLEIYGIDAWQRTGNFLKDFPARRIDAFITISTITMERFLSWAKLPESKGFLLPNAIHREHYGAGPKNPELLNRYSLAGKTVLMTMGRLNPHERYKGFDEMLEVLADVAAEIPNVAYMIAGTGDDRTRLEEKARALGVAGRVVFTGFIPEEEKADHFRLADVYVMPSSGEGFGFVFLEAMACGVPVISGNRDGGREALLQGELGILVDPFDTEALKSAIFAALDVPRGGVPEGLENFSFDNFSRRLAGVIDTMKAAG